MSTSVPDATVIRALAAKLQTLTPRDSDQIALLGFMVGVLYSLDRTVALGFEDTRVKLDAAVERTEHRRTLQTLTQGSTVDAPSLAGFYLDSAMMRLAALNERSGIYLGANHDVAAQIRNIAPMLSVDPTILRLAVVWVAPVIAPVRRWRECLAPLQCRAIVMMALSPIRCVEKAIGKNGKPLPGAAGTSFMKACEADAKGGK